jgi:Flp pilus assembly pilin Flp
VGLGTIYMVLFGAARWLKARDEMGASLVEYSLLLGLIVLVALVAMAFVGHATANSLNSTGSSLFPPH